MFFKKRFQIIYFKFHEYFLIKKKAGKPAFFYFFSGFIKNQLPFQEYYCFQNSYLLFLMNMIYLV